MNKSNVFNVQRFSIQDGPGIRTTVFFKGCPLKCAWCSNPESQAAVAELAHIGARCDGCGDCVKACVKKAIALFERTMKLDRQACDACGKCVSVCYPRALKIEGRHMPLDDVIEIVMKDTAFYRNSGGGVTASGGEPLMQAQIVLDLFKRCKQNGLNTCLETSGYAPARALEKVLEYTDVVYYDLKHTDSTLHKRWTGVGNDLILSNLSLVAKREAQLVIRIPVIPDVNDSDQNLSDAAELLLHLAMHAPIEVHILPYHRLGVGKYANLDREYSLLDAPSLTAESPSVLKAKETMEKAGLKCRVEI